MSSDRSWTAQDIPDQSDRVVVITGANSGLGLESAFALARRGAHVVMACRDPERGASARAEVAAVASSAEPLLQTLDLADLDSVRRAAAELSDKVDRVDVLMNNAGVMALPLRRTAQGHEMQFGTNHLGHFAFTGRLLALLAAAPSARVVTTSSQMHRLGKMHWDDLDSNRSYQRWPAYGQAKLANLLFAFELQRRASAGGSDLVSLAAHPGYASTQLQGAGPRMAGHSLWAKVMGMGNQLVAQTASQGALPQLFAATSTSVEGGDYYGPDGVGEMRGLPIKVKPSRAATQRDEARQLWEISENMTGVHFEWNG